MLYSVPHCCGVQVTYSCRPQSEEDILESLSLQIKREIGKVREDIINLKDAGLLKEVGNFLRFNPDMK